jgi:hypothetical protein
MSRTKDWFCMSTFPFPYASTLEILVQHSRPWFAELDVRPLTLALIWSMELPWCVNVWWWGQWRRRCYLSWFQLCATDQLSSPVVKANGNAKQWFTWIYTHESDLKCIVASSGKLRKSVTSSVVAMIPEENLVATHDRSCKADCKLAWNYFGEL